MDQWHADLADLVRRGRATLGDEAVGRGLAAALELIGQTDPPALRPPVPVLGVNGCVGGWVGVVVRPTGRTSLHVSTSITSLVEHVREQEALGVVAVGIPNGLPDGNGREVDAWVRSRPTVQVIEVHPELSFARMNGGPVLAAKKGAEGAAARRALLATAGIAVPHVYDEQGFAADDLLDACAAAWSAVRFANGVAESFPREPQIFGDGIGAAIRV